MNEDRSESIGLPAGKVRLAEYDPAWPRRYEGERARLASALAPYGARIEHIGSTAVSGLPAKPIIDIAVEVASLGPLDAIVQAMARFGYVHKGEYGLPGRQFFTAGEPVVFHVHVVARGCPHWADWISFRDHLRGHAEDRDRYAAHKRELAARYAGDRAAYTAAKDPFIRQLKQRAGVRHET